MAMKSEVRRFDRRGAQPLVILYKYALHLREQAAQRLRHLFKRGRLKDYHKAITKAMLANVDFTADAMRRGIAIPNLMPNSAQFWLSIGYEVFAMVRQLGRPSVFFTISAAEYHWPLLLAALKRLAEVRGQVCPGDADADLQGMPQGAVPAAVLEEVDAILDDVGDEQSSIPPDERLKLIRSDPIVCALYFREMVKSIKKWLCKKEGGPMGKYSVEDYVFRIEFQARGSPHLHCLLWLRNAPADPLKDPEEATKVVDEIISCSSAGRYAERNQHHHTATCFKKKPAISKLHSQKALSEADMARHCRFHAPFWPSPVTHILTPLQNPNCKEKAEDFVIAGTKTWRAHLSELQAQQPDQQPATRRSGDKDSATWGAYVSALRDLRDRLKDFLVSPDCPATVQGLWQQAGCPDEATYHLAIRCSLMRPMVLYRRAMADRWTNPHFPWALDIFGCNTDAQLVVDVFSLVRYCVSYMTKAETAHSELHREMVQLRSEGGAKAKELLYKLSSQALRAKETSAQEAAWVLLNLPLCEKSRKCQFINTSRPEQRQRSPKTKKETEHLPADSTDIWKPDVYEKYANSGMGELGVSLAGYVAGFQNCNRKPDAHGQPQPRNKDWIIRYRKFAESEDNSDEREEFYRAMCTLHIPWADEEADILAHGEDQGGESFETLYESHKDDIMQGRRRFEHNLDLEVKLEQAFNNCVAEDEAEGDELDMLARRYLAGTEKLLFEEDEGVAEHMDEQGQDILMDLPAPAAPRPAKAIAAPRSPGKWPRATFLSRTRMLNKAQRALVLTVIDGIRLRLPARQIYVDGTAGTGKSVVVVNIQDAAERFGRDDHPGKPKSLTSAPTGMAANAVDGITMHSTYAFGFNQDEQVAARFKAGCLDVFKKLDGEPLRAFMDKFQNVFVQLIDEVSMVSQSQLLGIDQRCKEAKGNNDIFGGLWTIVFGDFRQLPPVAGQSLMAVAQNDLVGSAPLWKQFEYIELTENMRQGDDKKFAEVLRKIGEFEQLSDEEQTYIESRLVHHNKLEVPDHATRVFFHNADVEKNTTSKISKEPAEKIEVLEACDRVEFDKNFSGQLNPATLITQRAKSHDYLDKASKQKTTKARGLPYRLLAVVGYPYLLTSNLDTADGLVNGAVGELRWIEFGRLQSHEKRQGQQPADSDAGGRKGVAPRRLWLRFPLNTGKARSAMYREALAEAVRFAPQWEGSVWPYEPPPPPTGPELQGLVPIERLDLAMDKLKGVPRNIKIKRQQFPMVSALALTSYKVQGSTKDAICTEYKPHFENSLVYVSLSRVTNHNGLFIDETGVKPDRNGRLFQHPPCLEPREGETAKEIKKRLLFKKEYEGYVQEKARLQQQPMKPRWLPILDAPASKPRFVYHNVQSLPNHLEDIKLDEVNMTADLLLFAETHLRPDDKVEFGPEWHEAARCDRTSGEKRGGGVAIFSRVPCKALPCPARDDMEAAMVQVGTSMRLAVLYCRGRPAADTVIELVGQLLGAAPAPHGVSTVVCGDFNINLHTTAVGGQGKRLVAGLAALGLKMKNSADAPTTYHDYSEGTTVIDAAFSDAPELRVERYQSYFSYHLPLVVFPEGL